MLRIAFPAMVLGLGLVFALPSFGMRPGLVAGVLGHAVLSLPYATAMVLASLANYDRSLERASVAQERPHLPGAESGRRPPQPTVPACQARPTHSGGRPPPRTRLGTTAGDPP